MRLIVAITALAVFPLSAQEDLDARKKRLGELFREKVALMKKVDQSFALRRDPAIKEKWEKLSADGVKLMRELAGEDREKQDALAEEVTKKYAPECREYFDQHEARLKNHRWAMTSLRVLVMAERDFRMNDREKNGVQDYWVKDVSGLCRITVDGQYSGMVNCIESSMAFCDLRACVPLEEDGKCKLSPEKESVALMGLPKPKRSSEYRFVALEKYGVRDGKWIAYDSGSGRNATMFGFAAIPIGYPKTGLYTMIVNEEGKVWMHDTAGKPPAGFPFDPAEGGWEKME